VSKITRRSVLRGSMGLVAAGALAHPYVANAAAKTATVWWAQGFVPEEDAAFRALVAGYEKASGNKIDYSIIPFAALRQKEVAAIATGVVADVMESQFITFPTLNAWQDKLLDITDVVEPQKANFSETANAAAFIYNNATKKRSYYFAPMKAAVVPFHIWSSLVEKGGGKIADLPDKWDAFLDYFEPLQAKLRKTMRNIYSYGYQITANGDDPNNTLESFIIAYGGKGLVTPDGKFHGDDPKVKQATIKAVEKLTTPFKKGFVPPVVTNWNDADDNNAFHAKLVVMDFDGTISTEVALYHNKEQYNDIVTHGLPLDNAGNKVPAEVGMNGAFIPKGAKNVAVAKEFVKYAIEPKNLNEYLKAGLGRWLNPMPSLVKSDPFWTSDPHRKAVAEIVLGPTVPTFDIYNPGFAQARSEHTLPLAMLDVVIHGMKPEAAVDKAFKRLDAIFAKYPVAAA
jgi:multiple sugar transport system substrate-binding protein